MKLIGAPDDLTAVVLVTFDGVNYQLEVCAVNDGSALPLERRILAKALRELADAVDEQATKVGD